MLTQFQLQGGGLGVRGPTTDLGDYALSWPGVVLARRLRTGLLTGLGGTPPPSETGTRDWEGTWDQRLGYKHLGPFLGKLVLNGQKYCNKVFW